MGVVRHEEAADVFGGGLLGGRSEVDKVGEEDADDFAPRAALTPFRCLA